MNLNAERALIKEPYAFIKIRITALHAYEKGMIQPDNL